MEFKRYRFLSSKITSFGCAFLFAVLSIFSQNIDPIKEPDYKLPDPLVCLDGSLVTSVKKWQEKRRQEIIEICEAEMYGRSPNPPKDLTFKILDYNEQALGGKATRKQIRISFNDKAEDPNMDVLIYYPNHVKGVVPVFLGLNFEGNHSIHPDPAIRLSNRWVWAGAAGAIQNLPTEKSRGSTSGRWPIDIILERGYAVVTAYAGDIDPDYHDRYNNGVHALYPELQDREDNFSTIAAWAWGLGRVVDYLETDLRIDENKIAVLGFSRMGKAALWAGAKDERFALVISCESGGGGAALSKRKVGEDVAQLNRGNPHWFNRKFKTYNNKEEALPFDQHMVIALIAPRPVYISSAEDDKGADPYGEFLSAKAAEPVYKIFGKTELLPSSFPAVDSPAHGTMGYHVRSGNHDINLYDWEQFLTFADKHFREKL